MPSLVHLLSAAVALSRLSAAAVADHELNDWCEAGIDWAFAAFDDYAGPGAAITDGCDDAAELTLCDAKGTGGPCSRQSQCTQDITYVDDTCDSGNTENGCCMQMFWKVCKDCEPSLLACGHVCSDDPLPAVPGLAPGSQQFVRSSSPSYGHGIAGIAMAAAAAAALVMAQ
eukprot:jgi/Ulvmu1/2009/UM012_0174.1